MTGDICGAAAAGGSASATADPTGAALSPANPAKPVTAPSPEMAWPSATASNSGFWLNALANCGMWTG
ncbi:hypothetical protein LAUMK4_01914 [Mycobacterium persicum]|uniref:Uncharacterized protein n=1 Tax=Mycobacterium persicum TaxID=1487726 RepID=A0ABY6RGL5_9MYCO|nr:hypothetical protein LAUMK4_01914 [Mycobacterium persicum]